MSRAWQVFLGAALLAGGIVGPSPSVALAEDPPSTSPSTVRVSGQITDAQTGQPLDGATVALSLSNERLRPRVTAVQGAYEVSLATRFRPQRLTVLASHGGYYAQPAEREVDATATALRVDLALIPEPRPPGAVGTGGGIQEVSIRLQATTPQSFTLALQTGWNLIAFPVAVSPPDPASIFGSLIAQGVTTGTLYHWNGSGYAMVQQVEPGRAYWVHCTRAASVTVSGPPLADATLILPTGAAMVGSPLLEPLPLSQVFVSRGEQHLSLVDAVEAGWLWPQYATWDPSRVVPSDPKSGYQVNQITPGTTLTLLPGQGLWIKALQDVSVSLGGPPPDTTPPSTPAVTDDGAKTTSQSALHATWTASSDPHSGVVAYEYQIRQDSATGTLIRDWTGVGTEREVTAQGLSLTLGTTYYLGVRAKNGAGLFSTPGFSNGITITTDATPPTGTITINSGATHTNTAAVMLTLTAQDNSGTVTHMQFSNDGTTYTAPEPFATSKAWMLPAGDGSKTVWVQFRDGADNWSTPKSAPITLDIVSPIIRITTPVDGTLLGAP